MHDQVVILVAEDDDGHAGLIQRNLARAAIRNPVLRFHDGQETMDFLLQTGDGPRREPNTSYVLLLDIRMPKLDGVEVLRRLKSDPELRKMPVVVITTTDDPKEVERCHSLGCSSYITKPVEYDAFVNAIRQLGSFLSVVEIPRVEGTAQPPSGDCM